MRLIDADELLRNKVWLFGCFVGDPYGDGYMDALDKVETVVREFPTVDAKPVVHGEWSTIEDDLTGMIALQCSECSQEYWFEEEAPMRIYKYCPNCGAKMDGGADNA